MTFSFEKETIEHFKQVKRDEWHVENFHAKVREFVEQSCTPEGDETHEQIADDLIRQVNQMTFSEWQATRERVTDNAEAVVGLAMYGDDDWKSDQCVAAHVYGDGACVEEYKDDDGKPWFFTIFGSDDCLSGTLEECEALLWDNHSRYGYDHKGDEGRSGFRQSFTQFRENRHEVAKDRAKLWENCAIDLDDAEVGYAYAAGGVPQIVKLNDGTFYAEIENQSIVGPTLYEVEAQLWDEWYAVEYSDSCKPRQKNEAFDSDDYTDALDAQDKGGAS